MNRQTITQKDILQQSARRINQSMEDQRFMYDEVGEDNGGGSSRVRKEGTGVKFNMKQLTDIYEQNIRTNKLRSGIPAQLPTNIPYSRILDKSCPIPIPSPTPTLKPLYILLHKLHLPTISPQSKLLLFWNLIIQICILFNLLQIPIAIFLTPAVYLSQFNTGVGLALNIVVFLLMFVDLIVVRMRIGYYYKGKLVVDQGSLWEKFVKTQLWIGSIGLIVLLIYMLSGVYYSIYIKILFYLKIYTFFNCDSQILHILQPSPIPFLLYRLSRLLLLLFFLTSLLACIFFFIDYQFYLQKGSYYINNQLWLTSSYAVGNVDIINNYNWFTWYSYALYWAIQTSSTVGYGDITPMNPPQVIFVILVILLMTILFAFYVNGIWRVLGDFRVGVEVEGIWGRFKNYLRKSDISNDLKQRLSNTIYQIYQDHLLTQTQQTLHNKISTNLTTQFQIAYKKTFYLQLPIFQSILIQQQYTQQNISNNLHSIKDLIQIIQCQSFSQGVFVYKEGDVRADWLYNVRKGGIKLGVSGGKLGGEVGVGGCFGQEGFFRRIYRNHSAQTTAFTKLWKISYQNLQKTLKNTPQLHQHYKYHEYQLIFNPSPKILSLSCWKCQSTNHFMSSCPQINSWQSKLTVNKLIGAPITSTANALYSGRMKNVSNLVSVLGNYGIGYGMRQKRVKFQRNSKIRSVGVKNVARLRMAAFGKGGGSYEIEVVKDFRFYFPEFNITSLII